MKQILLALLFLGGTWAFAQEETVVPVAKTLASLPLLELEGKSLGDVKLKTRFFDDHSLAMAEFVSGKTTLIFTGSSLGMKNALANGPAVHLVTPVWDLNSLVSSDPSIKSLADLRGKSVLVPIPGGPVDVQFKAYLKEKKLDGQVKIDYAEPVQAAALLVQKKAVAAILPEPLTSKLVLSGKVVEVTPFAALWAEVNQGDGRSPVVSLFARKDFIQAHPQFAPALQKELVQVLAQIKANPQAMAHKYAPVLGFPEDVILKGMKNTLFDLPDSQVQAKLFADYLRLTGETRALPPGFFRY